MSSLPFLLLVAAFAHIAGGHIVLENPAPYIFADYGASNPLSPDGSDYPCKIPAGTARLEINGQPTRMSIGQPQTLSFTGIAVHGGGSCQLALTPGFEPNRDSEWMVIHSIEGGCPVANQPGNLEPGQSPDTFPYAIPDGIEPGNYTFAWTWVNRIGGQPEFYMNCAPIQVDAGAGQTQRVRERRAAYGDDSASLRKRNAAGFPDLFLANIGEAGSGCLTSEALTQQVAIAYPEPGDSVSHPEGTGNLLQQPCDGNPRNSGNGGSQAPLPAESAAPEPPAEPTTAVESPVAEPPAAQPTVPIPPISSAAIINPPAPTLQLPAAPEGGACIEGHFSCIDGSQFSICTGGSWTPAQPLAANSRCVVGHGPGLDIINEW